MTAKKTAPKKDGGSQVEDKAAQKARPFAHLGPKLEADMLTAIRVSKQKRAVAPDIAARMGPVGDALERRAKMCVDKGLVPEGWHTCWLLIEEHDLNVNSGFVPVIDDKQQVKHAELELYMMDNKITEAEDAAQLARSEAKMRKPATQAEANMKNIPDKVIPAIETQGKAADG